MKRKILSISSLVILVLGISFVSYVLGARSSTSEKDIFARQNPSSKEIEKKELPPEHFFTLGQKYFEAKEYALALENFQKEVALGRGTSNEINLALYCIAFTQETMGLPPEVFSDSYYKAFFHTQKAEPLYRLALHDFKNENYILAYILSQYALSLPLPSNKEWKDVAVHNYSLLNVFAVSAFQIGNYKEAIEAFQRVAQNPNLSAQIRTEANQNLMKAEAQLLRSQNDRSANE